MPTEKIYKGKKSRYYRDGSIWVAQDGTLLWFVVKNDDFKFRRPDRINHPRIKKLPDGTLYVENRFKQRILVDYAVAICWCKPKPVDGQRYMLHHKDGDIENCNSYNLEWLPYHYKHTTDPKTMILVEGQVIEVHEDGTFKQGKEEVPVNDYGYDSDTDSFFYRGSSAYISNVPGRINGFPISPDELMRRAGYVNGDDAGLINPAILHKDYNPVNWGADNLEFVEATDERYKIYQQALNDYKEKRKVMINKELNV